MIFDLSLVRERERVKANKVNGNLDSDRLQNVVIKKFSFSSKSKIRINKILLLL